MVFSHVIGGMTFTEASFQGNAYADEATGFPKVLEKMVEHVANAYHGVSTDALTVGAGSKALTIANGSGQVPAFALGMPVRIARTSDPSGVWMQGEITAWDGATGITTINIDATMGSGSYSDWSIVIGGHLTIASGTPPLAVSQGGTGASSGKAALANLTPSVAGIIETNANFVDAVIFGPALDPVDWSPRNTAATSSLMLATVEVAGADAEVNVWDLTDDALAGATPLATIIISGAAAPTSIAAAMGYIVVGHEDGITIIDPHDGAWAERTVGWPRSLSTATTPALTNNNVTSVAAGFENQPPIDPRTGGPMPTFLVGYGTGADTVSVLKSDGTEFSRSGTGPVPASGVAIAGGNLIYHHQSTQIRRSLPIELITINNWSADGFISTNTFPAGLGHDAGFDFNNNDFGLADASGFTRGIVGVHTGGKHTPLTLAAMITRSYNTGYIIGDIRGEWLANSKTADRSYKANTLTETGTVTEAVVESDAELMGYSGFSASDYLSRAYDADFDFGTGDFSFSYWMKATAVGSEDTHIGRAYTSGARIAAQHRSSDGLRMELYDGSATVRPTYGQSIADSQWHFVLWNVDRAMDIATLYLDGVAISLASGADLSALNSLSNGSAILSLGVQANTSTVINITANTTMALTRISATLPTAAQARQMYEAEKGMFLASAKCLLQSGTTDAVLDISVDPLTGKIAVTQTDSAMIFDGLVVESEPSIAAGGSSWEHNRLYSGNRVEINDANLHATIAAKDLRGDLEFLRGLKAGLPPGVDLSKAKMWCYLSGTGTISIKASYNVKSITDNGVGKYQIDFGVSFKSNNYVHFVNGAYNEHLMGGFINAHNLEVRTANSSGTLTDDTWVFVVAFGELENE